MPGPPGSIKGRQEWIDAIDAQIDRLQQGREILAESTSTRRGKPARKRHAMSPEARAKISAAQKKRWAKARRA